MEGFLLSFVVFLVYFVPLAHSLVRGEQKQESKTQGSVSRSLPLSQPASEMHICAACPLLQCSMDNATCTHFKKEKRNLC